MRCLALEWKCRALTGYQEAVKQYEKASSAYAQAMAKNIQNENAMQAQADYVRRHASEDQGNALKSERKNLLSDASMAKDTSTIYSEEDQRRFQNATKNTDARAHRLQDLANVSDHYANPTTKITDMSDQEFQAAYTSYQEAKDQQGEYEAQAQAARKQADQYLRTNTAMYNVLTAKADQYQRKADAAQAKMDELTGGDAKVAYAIESRGESATLSRNARKDRNFNQYVKLGKRSDWMPKLRGAVEGMLNQIGYVDTHSDLIDAILGSITS